MNRIGLFRNVGLLIALALLATPLSAATYYLKAAPTTLTIGTQTIVMWGYALGTRDATGAITYGPAGVPGPTLVVPPGENLTIDLLNNLPMPTSIVIPGLSPGLASGQVSGVTFTDKRLRQRLYSLAPMVQPGTSRVYTFTVSRPGTYLYHSGTHVALQVQMGLYGAATQNASAVEAFAGWPVSKEIVMLYSEVDPTLPIRLAAPPLPAFDPLNPGAPPYNTKGVVEYAPKYFLVNGKPFNRADPPVDAGAANQAVLIRFLNAGFREHVPALHGGSYLKVIAEDANLYPFPKTQYQLTLPPLKTTDVIWTPPAAGAYAIYDRALSLTNGPAFEGGLFSYLAVGTPGVVLTAGDDAYSTSEDTPLTVAAPGVLANDSAGAPALVSNAAHGSVALALNGGFTYTPAPNYNGTDSFSYRVSAGAAASDPAVVTIGIAAVADAPVAIDDTLAAAPAAAITLNVLANDTNVDATQLAVAAVTPPASGAVAPSADGRAIVFTPPSATWTGSVTFTYTATNGVIGNAANVTVTVAASNTPPLAVNDSAEAKVNTSSDPNNPSLGSRITIDVVANDIDPDGNLDPATVEIVVPPNQGGTVINHANGTVSYWPRRNFRGSESFLYTVRDRAGVVSNAATVVVNVVR